MGRPRKPPAFLVEATVSDNQKLADLGNDKARLGFFYIVLAKAKTAEPIPGQFSSRELFRERAGRFARYLDDYIRVGILEVAPGLCQRCRDRWASMPPKRSTLVVHDWHEHQYDPWKVERQREYEDRLRSDAAAEEERRRAAEEAAQGGVSDAISDAKLTEFPTRYPVGNPRVSDAVSDGVSDADSRAPAGGGARDRGRGRTQPRPLNVERRTFSDESTTSPSGAPPSHATDPEPELPFVIDGGRAAEKKNGMERTGDVLTRLTGGKA
jgi:hypothetical protein